MSVGKAPAPPDYVGAANAQGQANLESAIASGHINNPNVINPYGTQTVTWSGENPTITQSLTPEQQAILKQQNYASSQLGIRAGDLAQRLNNTSATIDYNGIPDAPIADPNARREDVINSLMSRVNTDTANQRADRNSELIAAGIRPGTKAYDDAMNLIDRQYNDARNNAILAGGQESTRDFGLQMDARKQAIAEALTKRQTPLNELNAVLSGAQVQNPFAGGLGYQAGQQVGAAPIAQGIANQGQAQQNIFNQNQAARNANINAGAGLIGSLGSAAIQSRYY